MRKNRQILTLSIVFLFFTSVKCQSIVSTTIGLGLNSAIYFTDNYYAVPSSPITPYLSLKIKRHEFTAGPDFYPFIKKYTIIGWQVGYRLHFKEGRRLHPFIDCNFQYVTFQSGCGGPRPYNYIIQSMLCYDGAVFKNKSFLNSFGIGAQFNVSKKVYFYGIAGLGYNYYENKVYMDWTGYGLRDSYNIRLFGNIRAGLCFNFHQK